jgi:hypothetical protein
MKQILLLTLAYFLSESVKAQSTPLIKIHAYVRHSTPGAVPKVVAIENGGAVKKMPTSLVNYSIYAELKKSSTITITRLWIEGKAYTTRKEAIKETPVLFKQPAIGNQYQTDTLVPKTNNIVWKLIQEGLVDNSPKAPKNLKGNDLLVEYIWKGKKYNYVIKEWEKLPPLILQ